MNGPIQAVPINVDGTDREFKITLGAVRRLRDKHGINLLAIDPDKLEKEAADFLGAVIYECSFPKPKEPFDEWLDLLTIGQAPDLMKIITSVAGASKENPIPAASEAVAAPSD